MTTTFSTGKDLAEFQDKLGYNSAEMGHIMGTRSFHWNVLKKHPLPGSRKTTKAHKVHLKALELLHENGLLTDYYLRLEGLYEELSKQ